MPDILKDLEKQLEKALEDRADGEVIKALIRIIEIIKNKNKNTNN